MLWTEEFRKINPKRRSKKRVGAAFQRRGRGKGPHAPDGREKHKHARTRPNGKNEKTRKCAQTAKKINLTTTMQTLNPKP